MKFVNTIITLLAASSAFGITADRKRRLRNACNNELAPYQVCDFYQSGLSELKISQYCNEFQARKCLDFYKNPYTYAPDCLQAKMYYGFPLISGNLQMRTYEYTMFCAKNNEGKMCEINKFYFDHVGVDKLDEVTDANCRSKTCTKVYRDLLAYTLNLDKANGKEEGVKVIQRKIAYIDSDECQSKQSTKKTTTAKKTTAKKTTTAKSVKKTTTTVAKKATTTKKTTKKITTTKKTTKKTTVKKTTKKTTTKKATKKTTVKKTTKKNTKKN